MLLQIVISPHTESEWFGKSAQAHIYKLIHVQRIGQRAYLFYVKGSLSVIKIETGKFMQTHLSVEMRIRRPRYNINLMSKIAQGFAQMFNVDALPATGGVAPVSEQTNF
jgi:hypothetical protein